MLWIIQIAVGIISTNILPLQKKGLLQDPRLKNLLTESGYWGEFPNQPITKNRLDHLFWTKIVYTNN